MSFMDILLTDVLFTVQPITRRDSIMGYEDSVYLAKLAEQAERYEGACDPPS